MKLVFAIIALGFPALELAGIYQVWQSIGAWTLLWLMLAVVAGVLILRIEQLEFLPRLMYAAFEGNTPLSALWESGRRVFAALLLIFPGLLSDIVALVLLLWPTPPGPRGPRRRQRPWAADENEVSEEADAREAGVKPRSGGRSHDVIEGEYRRVDD